MANHENDVGDGLTFWEWSDSIKIIDYIHHHNYFQICCCKDVSAHL
jgi:hypothetical protein